ncbi:MAG: hypothetical protein RB191_20495 [Terriglobia bacterium]|nr:hypothetical protein [Terriglobia bacterium]
MEDVVTIIALLVGPLAAVVTQLWFESRRERRRQKHWVFHTLMSNRRTVLNPDFVRALNSIDVVFYSNSTVRKRFRDLLQHYSLPDWRAVPISPELVEKARDLTAQLLAEMAKDLNYSYDHTDLKDNAYAPQGWENQENEFMLIRKHLIPVLDGTNPIGVMLREPPIPTPTMSPKATLTDVMMPLKPR